MALIIGDIIAIVTSFLYAYLIRTRIDSRPFYFESNPTEFIVAIVSLIPIWIFILAALGLYDKKIILARSHISEVSRLFLASIIGVMAIISVDFFLNLDLFPVRPIAFYAVITCFVSLVLVRFIIRLVRESVFRKKIGLRKALIIGNNQSTLNLIEDILANPELGYEIVAVVSKAEFIPKELRKKFRFSSLKAALSKTTPDIIFQTDEDKTDYVYKKAIENHLFYFFVPNEAHLSEHMGSLELIGSTPAILVKVTPLVGGARVLKRLIDIILGGIITILALIPMGILAIIQKILDPKSPVFYSQIRLSRFNKKVKIYKFRSMKSEYSGMTPEQAFEKMQKEGKIKNAKSLSRKYRKNGDYLKDDPRITKFGDFLRRTSLDELPQLFNVLKGDISLVGPRALIPGELRNYGDRSLLLSVKSGLTGLAQVSGRRNISFKERRALDLYYIQNWSIKFDFQILAQTVRVVLTHKGAK